MTKPDFAYAIYIRATREEVWNGLLEPEFTRQYWIHDNVSDWKVVLSGLKTLLEAGLRESMVLPDNV